MILLKLTDEEQTLLMELLESEISELRMEIAHTDRREYKEMLKSREILLKKLQQELEHALEREAVP